MKYLFIAFLFVACIADKKKEDRQLDIEALEIQRLAFWQRTYYFDAIKWKGINADSFSYYDRKVDSVVALYKEQVIRYDTMVKLYKQKTN